MEKPLILQSIYRVALVDGFLFYKKMSSFSLHIDARLRDTRRETRDIGLSRVPKSRVPCQKNNCSLILNTYLLKLHNLN